MTKRYYILSLVLLLCAGMAFAQERLKATASKTQVATGEPFEITFSTDNNASNFSPPDFKNFQVISGPNESTSMTVINGAMSSSTSYSYELIAIQPGSYAINSAAITVNGRRVLSSPVVINVVKGKYVPQNNQQQVQQNAPDEDINTGAEKDLSKLVFIKADVDKTQVYQGQQLTVTYKLYTRAGLSGSDVDKLPDFNGFWSQDISLNPNQAVRWSTEYYKGKQFNVATLKQTILYPQHAGNLTVDVLGMTFDVRQPVQARDIMDQFFGAYRNVKYKAKSIPITIHVKPLPDAGKPAGFEDAVGNFTVQASTDKNELKANEALNYKIRITGSGGIKLLNAPKINFPPDFEKYDPKVTDSITEDASGVKGYRIYNFLLIPRHEGNFTIDSYHFSYFNPATQRYVTLATQPIQVKVNKGLAANNVTAYAPTDKQDVKVVGNDIRYIKTTAPDLYNADGQFYGSATYYILLFIGPLAFAGALGYRKWEARNNSNAVLVKSRRANKIAAKHLANAQKQLAAGNTKAFYEDVAKGLYGYLSDKLNIPLANLNKETISGQLKAKGLNDTLINGLLSTLDLCEMARYSPVTGISKEEVFEKSKNMINDIEDKI